MKHLYLLRHAKAEGHSPMGDHGRRLTEHRGVPEARAAGKALKHMLDKREVDIVLASDSARTMETAHVALKEAGVECEPRATSAIYAADVSTLLEIVQSLRAGAKAVLLVGHNPGIEDLAFELAKGDQPFSGMPTSGLIALDFDIAAWTDVQPHSGRIAHYFTPGMTHLP